jgi:hypothetical protein
LRTNDPRALALAFGGLAVGLAGWAWYVYTSYELGHASVLRAGNLGKGVAAEVLAAGIVFAAAAALGSALLAAAAPIAERGLRLITATALGAGFLATMVFLLGQLGLARLPEVVVLLALPLAFGGRALVRDLFAAARAAGLPSPPAMAFLGLALLQLVSALSPPNDWDETSYHLPLAVLTAATGRYPLHGHDFSSFPQLCESLTAIGVMLGANPGVGRVLHMLFGWTLAAAVYLGASSLTPGRWQPWLAVAVVMTEPIFISLSHVAGVDLAVALFAVLGVIHILRDGGARSVALAGVLGGFGCGATFRGLYPAIGLAVAAVVAGRARALWVLALGGVLAASPWYVRNFLVTGDPVYPFAAGLFHVRPPPNAFSELHWPLPALQDRLFEQAALGIHMGPLSFLRLPWDATILGRAGTGTRFDDNISPFYLAMAPALLFVRPSRVTRPTWVWVAFGLALTFVWSLGVQGTRYELPAFCAFGITLPALLAAYRWEGLARACRWLCAGLLAVMFASACIMLVDRGDTLFVFGPQGPHHYLTSHGDGPLFAHVFQINRTPPTPGPVLMLGDKRTLYLERPVIADIFLDNLGVLYRNAGGDPDRMAERLRESGIRDILEHTIQMHLTATPEEIAAYDEMTKRHTDVADQNSYLVWRVLR